MQFDADRFMSEANSTFISYYEPSENKSDGQRYGQFLINKLTREHPEIMEQLPEEVDCFYDNGRVLGFLNFIYELSDKMFAESQTETN